MNSLGIGDVRDNGLLDLFYTYLKDFLKYVSPFVMISFSLIAVSLLIALMIRALKKADDDDDDYDTYYY